MEPYSRAAWIPLYSELSLQSQVASAACFIKKEISKYRHRVPLFFAVGQGGFPLARDLGRVFDENHDPYLCTSIHVKSYEGETRGDLLVAVNPIHSRLDGIKDAVIPVIVDDICDSGHTLQGVHEYIAQRMGVPEVLSVVAVHRAVESQVYSPSFAMFTYGGSEFLCGYGMDDGQPGSESRKLPYIARKVSAFV